MGKDKNKRHKPLAEDVMQPYVVSEPSKRRKERERKRRDSDDEFVGSKLSQRILDQARQQQEDLQEEMGFEPVKKITKKPTIPALSAKEKETLLSSEEEDSEEEIMDDSYEPVEVDEEDEKAMRLFMSDQPPVRRTLADIVMEKIRDKKTELSTVMSESGVSTKPKLDDKVVSIFKSVGKILAKYRSGKLPKAFKVIPSLSNWEELLYLTEPDSWSAGTVYQATRIFASNMKGDRTQRFFNLVLLPRFRDDIAEYKRLNYHIYMALKKALFKPAAFFKGIVLPLCESGTCTLREAVILSSVLAKTSIPMLHSSAALLKIAEMEYSGANSIFIKTLLDKKYALPYRVVDSLVHHFLRFTYERRTLPVLWHQSLLTFVQRYKEDLSTEQKEAILDLIKKQSHHQISFEVRREIISSKSRDSETPGGLQPADQTMD